MFNIFGEKKNKDFSSKITINGVTIVGDNITVKNGKILVDGKDITPDSKEIYVTVNGNINNLEIGSCNSLIISGDVKSIKSGSTDINCHDINGNVSTGSGDVSCNNITGDISTGSGDIDCDGLITGSVKTSSGDIKFKK